MKSRHDGQEAKRPRAFTTEFDHVGPSSAILADPNFAPYAASIARREEYAPSSPERHGFTRKPGPRLLSEAEIQVLPVMVGASDHVATLLVDQSGNLRGCHSDRIVALVDRVAFALESAGVPFEVLGFTTLRWKGGLSREKWVAAGKPENPGRLNDLLHVVHKEVDEAWSSGSPSPRERLDLMMRDPYLREGLDGGAIDWALDRLKATSASIRTLIPITDATPVEEATMAADGTFMLEADLVRAIKRASLEGVALEPIGVRCDSRWREFVPDPCYMPTENGHLEPTAAAEAVLHALGLAPASVPVSAPSP